MYASSSTRRETCSPGKLDFNMFLQGAIRNSATLKGGTNSMSAS